MKFLKCNCGKSINSFNCITLADFKNFTSRKILFAHCPLCKNLVLTLIQQRQEDEKVFINENLQGPKALKILNNELIKKRIIETIHSFSYKNISNWLFGKNIQLRNKNGDVTQIRQYSSDFFGNTKLVKVIDYN